MTFRFRKSIRLAPGVRLNLSGRGFSWTLGPRGASIGVSQHGTFLNTGIPGTGLYSRHRIGGQAQTKTSASRVDVSMTASIADDGQLVLKDSNGDLATEVMIEAAKKQKGDFLRQIMRNACNEINAQVDTLTQMHIHTPCPNSRLTYQAKSFSLLKPTLPTLKVPGFFARLIKSKSAGIENENLKAQAEYENQLRQWESNKRKFEEIEGDRRKVIVDASAGNTDSMAVLIDEALQNIVWPRETIISYEIAVDAQAIDLDVDLPEVEEIPSRTAVVPQRGFKLSIKEMTSSQIQKLYAKHIHAVIFRLIGEVFGTLPTIQRITISGYTQRKSKLTGYQEDHYLLSVVVMRQQWQEINFEDLVAVDPIDALNRFELIRDMTKTGILRTIKPFTEFKVAKDINNNLVKKHDDSAN